MTKQTYKHGYDMIYLAACAIHQEVPAAERIASMSLPDVYRIAKHHGMQAITFSGLELRLASSSDTAEKIPKELLKKWAEDKAKSIRKNILLEAERSKLFDFLDAHAIWYMPLKGVILQDFYPEYGMRQMVDNDILFDSNYRDRVREYFLENGYSEAEREDESHDVYSKLPVYNFEMHFSLHRRTVDSLFYEYYKNVKERLLPVDAAHPMECRFSDEDFYIYCLSHSYKHFLYAGIGIRSLLDIYVYLDARKEELDWGYIAKECETLRMTSYEKNAKALAETFFRKPGVTEEDLTEEEQELAEFFLSSGSHGTAENRIVQKIRASSREEHSLSVADRFRYLLQRLFPDMDYIQKYYPLCGRYKILLPFLVFWRGIKLLLLRPKDLFTELKLVWKTKK
ncbi:MAG: nucleotidyltransferase family protein [Clostridia bacterium]|nr:nucleotidyltransferase family protein [Clostridia bacterium]